MLDTKVTYVRLQDGKTHCPECLKEVTLVQDKQIRENKPMFYVCWTCEAIFEIGRGEVLEIQKGA